MIYTSIPLFCLQSVVCYICQFRFCGRVSLFLIPLRRSSKKPKTELHVSTIHKGSLWWKRNTIIIWIMPSKIVARANLDACSMTFWHSPVLYFFISYGILLDVAKFRHGFNYQAKWCPRNRQQQNVKDIWGNGDCSFVLNKLLSVRERIDLAFDLPDLLNEKRMLTQAELESKGYLEAEADKIYWIKTPTGRYPGAIRMSAQFLKKHGLLQRLVPLRKRLLSEEFLDAIGKISKLPGSKTRFLLGLTEKPLMAWNSVQIGKIV